MIHSKITNVTVFEGLGSEQMFKDQLRITDDKQAAFFYDDNDNLA